MTDDFEWPLGIAYSFVGWVEGGLHKGFLGESPAWWVDGIRERLARLDAVSDQAARMAKRLVEEGPGR